MIEDFDASRPLTGSQRLSAKVLGFDVDLLAQCPARDRTSVSTLALLLGASCLWQAGSFSFTAHSLVAEPGTFRWELMGVGGLFAAITFMTDAYIIANGTFMTGVDQLKRGGLEIPGYTKLKIKYWVQLSLRFGLASVYAELIAVGVLFCVFQKDINHRLDREASQQNIGLERQISGQYDANSAQMSTNLGNLQTARTDAAANVEKLRADALRAPTNDPELAAVTARVSTLESAKVEAERRLAGVPREATVQRYIAQRLLTARRTDLEKAQKDQEALRRRADGAQQAHGTTIAKRLDEAINAEANYQSRASAQEAVLAKRAEMRATTIRTAMEQDPRFVPPERGILARARALAKLTQDDGWVLTLVLLFHAASLGIELAAVLAKVMSSVPSSYAVQLAGEEYATEVETADSVFKRIGALNGSAPPAPATEEADDPERAAFKAANDDALPEEEALDTAERLRNGAQAARAQAAARAKAKDRAKDPARDKPAEAADDADAAPATDDLTAGPVRRGPGRPPGARNKLRPDNDDRPPSEDGQDVA